MNASQRQPPPFDDHDNDHIRRGVARGDSVCTTAGLLCRRAADVGLQRIALGLSEHEEFLGLTPLPALAAELHAI